MLLLLLLLLALTLSLSHQNALHGSLTSVPSSAVIDVQGKCKVVPFILQGDFFFFTSAVSLSPIYAGGG